MTLRSTVENTEPVAASVPVEAPPRHPRYEIVDIIGRGGSGVVYRAFDRELGQEVALKTLRSRTSPEALKTEFRTRARVHHPHLLLLFDLVIIQPDAFFTMELVASVGFLDWVWGARPAGARGCSDDSSVGRLIDGAWQLLSALQALHAEGVVHCDVKPDNVLVTSRGHVLLSDFGLASHIASDGSPAEVIGTPSYMAPERKRGAPERASDLYSVGVVLVEALTGLARSRDLRSCEALVDRRLLALVELLLSPDPSARPTAHEAAEALRALQPGLQIRTSTNNLRTPSVTSFFGREEALATARALLSEASPASLAILTVEGASGIGKSAFVNHLLANAAGSDLVLRGRCHPHELVDFGAWHDVVAELAPSAQRLSATQNLSSHERSAMAKVFPVLGVSEHETLEGLDLQRGEVRRMAFAALRSVLTTVAHDRRVILWLDDLQWADGDCLELLEAITDGGADPGCVLILSYRPVVEADDRVRDVLRRLGPRSTGIALGPLGPDEIRAVFRGTLGDALPAARLDALTTSANGSPLFAQVLARGERSRAHGSVAPPNAADGDVLESLVNECIESLPTGDRDLVDIVLMNEGPVALQVAALAARETERALTAIVNAEQLGLISRAPGRDLLRVVAYHDRVRQSRVRRLDQERTSRVHVALLEAHESLRTNDYEALVHHAEAIQDQLRTRRYAEAAGDLAADGLAFAAASSYYERALRADAGDTPAHGVERKLAESLSAQGLGTQAGSAYERAAAGAVQLTGASIASMQLEIRAAEQFFHSAQFEDGFRLMRTVLARLGIKLPASNATCIAQSAFLRVRFMLRGFGFRPTAAEGLSIEETLRLDVLWTASTCLAHVNHALADVLLLRHMLGALALGDAARIQRSFSNCAAAEAALAGPLFARRVNRMFDEVTKLESMGGSAYNAAWDAASRAATDFFRADWASSIRHAEIADERLERYRFHVTWERSINYVYWTSSLALSGRVAELVRRRDVAHADAVARHDALAQNHVRAGYPALARLYTDDVATARAEMADLINVERVIDPRAMRRRGFPEQLMSTLDYHNLLALSHLDLYQGAFADAWERLARIWPSVEAALFHRVQLVGADLRFLYARAALAAPTNDPRETRKREKVARAQVHALRRDQNRFAAPCAALLAGTLAARAGREDDAARELETAATQFEAVSMPIHAAAVRHRREQLARRNVPDRRLEELRALGVVEPERIVDLFAPPLFADRVSPTS
ncbi:MAG: protein kinase [Labilithrix sp.]|nr:protein kinase [Labilithrix sp.]